MLGQPEPPRDLLLGGHSVEDNTDVASHAKRPRVDDAPSSARATPDQVAAASGTSNGSLSTPADPGDATQPPVTARLNVSAQQGGETAVVTPSEYSTVCTVCKRVQLVFTACDCGLHFHSASNLRVRAATTRQHRPQRGEQSTMSHQLAFLWEAHGGLGDAALSQHPANRLVS